MKVTIQNTGLEDDAFHELAGGSKGLRCEKLPRISLVRSN